MPARICVKIRKGKQIAENEQVTSLDPIIAVKDVAASASWYQQVFAFKKAHGGNNFAVLTTDDKKIILCLHKWQADNHPTIDESEGHRGKWLTPLLQNF